MPCPLAQPLGILKPAFTRCHSAMLPSPHIAPLFSCLQMQALGLHQPWPQCQLALVGSWPLPCLICQNAPSLPGCQRSWEILLCTQMGRETSGILPGGKVEVAAGLSPEDSC